MEFWIVVSGVINCVVAVVLLVMAPFSFRKAHFLWFQLRGEAEERDARIAEEKMGIERHGAILGEMRSVLGKFGEVTWPEVEKTAEEKRMGFAKKFGLSRWASWGKIGNKIQAEMRVYAHALGMLNYSKATADDIDVFLGTLSKKLENFVDLPEHEVLRNAVEVLSGLNGWFKDSQQPHSQ